ncbi:Sulfite exporter TauE/SafE family protein 3 [Phytophthora citrophthora]|uniref:Sulfite exporter TauE/SafE family protein 3 n=1 Tax=Phytophthora citrophthora TaxID=4793 RepID=A0AAD9GVI4_9STRA|nr:Sulfite exporter TauE/SafE family protein 3 [Phytophthora citrophthora]
MTIHRRQRHVALSLFVLAVLAATAIAADSSSNSSSSDDDGVPSLSEMDTYDALAIAFMVIGLAVSSAGGVGGGVIMVPAMVLIMGFDIKRATPISNVAILGGAVANAWFNMRKRHPTVDRPLIDPELALGMIPVVIGGTVLGALINKLIPSYVLSLLFVVVLVVGGSRTMKKGIRLHKKELAARKEAEAATNEVTADIPASPGAYVQVSTPQTSGNDDVLEEKRSSISATGVTKAIADGEAGGSLSQILEKERHFAWGPHIAIMICYLGVVAASIGDASVDCGGVAYWVILLIEIPWVAVFVVLTSHYLHKVYLRKTAVNYQYVDGDIQWTKKMVVYFPVGCAIAGIVAGMFGVGGGIITGPIMIELGIVPEVASSTTALMILYSSAAATAKFAVFKMVAWDWALLLCAVAFVVTSASQVVILGFVRRTGRQSIIVLCIATAVLIGGIIMTYQAIKTTIDDAGDPFSADICS